MSTITITPDNADVLRTALNWAAIGLTKHHQSGGYIHPGTSRNLHDLGKAMREYDAAEAQQKEAASDQWSIEAILLNPESATVLPLGALERKFPHGGRVVVMVGGRPAIVGQFRRPTEGLDILRHMRSQVGEYRRRLTSLGLDHLSLVVISTPSLEGGSPLWVGVTTTWMLDRPMRQDSWSPAEEAVQSSVHAVTLVTRDGSSKTRHIPVSWGEAVKLPADATIEAIVRSSDPLLDTVINVAGVDQGEEPDQSVAQSPTQPDGILETPQSPPRRPVLGIANNEQDPPDPMLNSLKAAVGGAHVGHAQQQAADLNVAEAMHRTAARLDNAMAGVLKELTEAGALRWTTSGLFTICEVLDRSTRLTVGVGTSKRNIGDEKNSAHGRRLAFCRALSNLNDRINQG